jgi:hypothetical protein
MALIAQTTKSALQAGSTRLKWVLVVEGYPRLITDATPAKAVAAWAGTDFTQAIDGLVVEYRANQAGNPHEPFTGGAPCILHIKQDAADTFGVEVNRRGSGAWTTISTTIDRNDTALAIKAGASFTAAPGEAYIGTECVGYSAVAANSMTLSARGKYSAEGVASSGSGSTTRFATHHRVSKDQDQVQMNPIVSQQPRRWLGRRVYLYLHLVDADGNLNAKADAQRVFVGRVRAIADDSNTFHTVIRCTNILDEIGDCLVARNQWAATVMQGIYIPTGAYFKLTELKGTGATKTTTQLSVVASGAGANQINAGYYSLEEISIFLNSWLGGEKTAARIDGQYTWISPFDTGSGIRTKVDWLIADASSSTLASWKLELPGGVAGLLGLSDKVGVTAGGMASWVSKTGNCNTTTLDQGEFTPYRTVVFSKGGPGGSLPTFKITTESERGEFVDCLDIMPGLIKPTLDTTKQWGLFLIDEKILIQGSYSNGVLSDCFITPFGQNSAGDSNSPQPFYTLGRRADEDGGPVTVRQVFDIEGTFEQITNILFYNTGTPGYNHADYDIRAYGFGAGIPGQLLGAAFERSVKNLPSSDAVMRLRFDEPTSLRALIGDELVARRAFLVWKDGGLLFNKWHTPVVSLATFNLRESNKAAPAGTKENHRTPTLESAEFARPIVKFDFDPDFSFGREVRYRASAQLEDSVAVDDGGGEVGKGLTLKLRNSPGHSAPDIVKNYLASMPMTSRPSKYLSRSIEVTLFEGIAPGDMCLVYDEFARDPVTGARGIDARPAVVVSHSYDYGGPVPGRPQDKARKMTGEIEVNFFDVNRGGAYGPSADVDDTAGSGGFTAGYNNATRELQTYDHRYSESSESIDAANFAAGYTCVIVERDPADPASPVYWERTVESVSGNKIKFTVALAAPAFDTTKKYRVIFNKYSLATGVQRDCAFQADDADELVEDLEAPYLFCSTPEPLDYTQNAGEAGEFTANLSFGDGKSLDVGHEVGMLRLINAMQDYKTAHQSPSMWTEQPSYSGTSGFQSAWFGIIYLGQLRLSNVFTRHLTVAPWLALDNSAGAVTGSVRVTISRDLPKAAIGSPTSTGLPSWSEAYVQATFTTTTTTWAQATPQLMQVNVKELTWGTAFLTLEINNAMTRGLSLCIESPRKTLRLIGGSWSYL